MAATITVTIDQNNPTTIPVSKTKPGVLSAANLSDKEAVTALRNELWSGDWQHKTIRVIIWDDAAKKWRMWEK